MFVNKGGATAPTARFDVFNSHSEIIIANTQWNFENLAPGVEFSVDMNFSIGSNAINGATYELPYAVQHGKYVLLDSYFVPVGRSMEGFETGDFSAFDWHSTSPIYAWEVVGENPYEGNYCARSSAIQDGESTMLYIDLNIASEGEVSFYYKVSSESGYDKLHFRIDDVDKGNWSGEVGWSQASFPLTPGTHRLQWVYSKDVYVSSGSDCAWIDNVVFPAAQLITMATETFVNEAVIFPNPNNGSFSINLPEEECEIAIYNSLGQMMYQTKGNGLTTLSLNNLSQGVYFVTVKSSTLSTTQKFIKE